MVNDDADWSNFLRLLMLLMVKAICLRNARLICYVKAEKEPARNAAALLYLAKVK